MRCGDSRHASRFGRYQQIRAAEKQNKSMGVRLAIYKQATPKGFGEARQ